MTIAIGCSISWPGMAPGTGTPEPGGMTGRELLRAVSSRPQARAYRVSADGEHQLAVQYLGAERAALAAA